MSLQIRIVDTEKPEPRAGLARALRTLFMIGVWALVALAAVAVGLRLLG